MKPGDTLVTVAAQFNVTLEALVQMNRASYGPYPTMERPGVVVKVPEEGELETLAEVNPAS